MWARATLAKHAGDAREPCYTAEQMEGGEGWIFGLHDRPWGERPVFGTVRTMTEAGLRRKTDPEAYVARVDRLVEEAEAAG